MPKYFKDWSRHWGKLSFTQKISFVILATLLFLFPISVLLTVNPKQLLRPRATYPATPPSTPPCTNCPTPTFNKTSILAVIFNDQNNNLILDNGEELISKIWAIVWVCKLDQYKYTCDNRYPTRVGEIYHRSYVEIPNIIPGINEVWIHTFNAYPEKWYTPSSKPYVVDALQDKQYIALLPMSKNPYPIYPTKPPYDSYYKSR